MFGNPSAHLSQGRAGMCGPQQSFDHHRPSDKCVTGPSSALVSCSNKHLVIYSHATLRWRPILHRNTITNGGAVGPGKRSLYTSTCRIASLTTAQARWS